ncbi:MAG: hypothetical protein RR334_03330, partial [Clostridia bacterium]
MYGELLSSWGETNTNANKDIYDLLMTKNSGYSIDDNSGKPGKLIKANAGTGYANLKTLSLRNMNFDVNTSLILVVKVNKNNVLNVRSLGVNPKYLISTIIEPTTEYLNT